VNLLSLTMAAAVAGAAAPSPGNSPPSAPAPASHSAKPADDPDKMICRDEPITGSRFTRRVCMTKSQWDQLTAEAARMRRQTEETTGLGGGGSSPF
jgi:hypothetical protein